MNEFFTSLQTSVGPTVWNLIIFLLILVIGYVVAKIVESVTRSGLNRTTLDDKLARMLSSDGARPIATEHYVSKGMFWLIMLFVFIAAFESLNLAAVSEPLSDLVSKVLGFLPNLLAAAVLALAAFVLATLLRTLTTRALHAANVDERINQAGSDPTHRMRSEPSEGSDTKSVSSRDATASGARAATAHETSIATTLGEVVYYFVLLLFLPAILGTLQLEGILAPVQELVDEIIGFLPNLLLAGVILIIGAFVAKVIRNIVSNLLAAVGTDRLSERVGLSKATGTQRLSSLIGLIVYVLILIPVIVAALNALQVDAVTEPASAMLDQFMAAIPRVFVAALILVVAYVVGRLVASLTASVLAGVGFNRLFERLGFASATTAPPASGEDRLHEGDLDTQTPAGIAGIVVLVAVMLFAAAEAATSLNLEVVASLIAEFTVLGGRILLGLLIFGVGLYLANLAYSAVKSSETNQATVLAVASRVAILVLAGAMALKQMGLADSIINLAFGLILGALAVAAALAFGLGGRDAAREEIERFRGSLHDGNAPEDRAPKRDASGTTEAKSTGGSAS